MLGMHGVGKSRRVGEVWGRVHRGVPSLSLLRGPFTMLLGWGILFTARLVLPDSSAR